jgi:tryptophanyl-tRNA synthetase
MNNVILTGVQSSGHPHLGNYFGAIKPVIDFSKSKANKTILFIADIHSLTTIKDAKERQDNIYANLASFLSLGFDFDKNILFKQSDVPQVCELQFYLSCFTPYTMLTGAHSFKDKSENLSDINAGLFTYPVLMASDILMYDVDLVPVGKDQKQHLEMTRDIATKFNNLYGHYFTIPESFTIENQMIIPGIDGRKMSKSYGNFIDPFQDERKLRKTINRIVTNSAGVNDPKDHTTCTVFQLYSLFATDSEKQVLIQKYQDGIMYSEAKTMLFEKIMEEFEKPRVEYNKIINDKDYLNSVLRIGANKANQIASKKIKTIKEVIGLSHENSRIKSYQR